MCVYSMIMDHWEPLIPHIEPYQPIGDPDALRRQLEEFRKAQEAAVTIDTLTGKPDCEDPTKAKLVERVEALEKRLRVERTPMSAAFHAAVQAVESLDEAERPRLIRALAFLFATELPGEESKR